MERVPFVCNRNTMRAAALPKPSSQRGARQSDDDTLTQPAILPVLLEVIRVQFATLPRVPGRNLRH